MTNYKSPESLREALEHSVRLSNANTTTERIVSRATAFAEFLEPTPQGDEPGDKPEATAEDFERSILEAFEGPIEFDRPTTNTDIALEITPSLIIMRIDYPSADGRAVESDFFGFGAEDIAVLENAIADWKAQR